MYDPRRLLDFPALLNARDLGGYRTLDGSETRWGALVRTDDLAQLTAAGVHALGAFGVETIIDLRWTDEAAANPNPVAHALDHVRCLNISLLGPSQAHWQSLTEPWSKERWKCLVLERASAEIKAVLQAIAASPPGPLLFHCVAGKDRTGLVAALLLTLADVVPDAIAYDYAMSAECLREAYLQRFGDTDPDDIREAVRCPEEGVHRMLDYLAQRGGVHAYLAELGLTHEEIARLRARLRS